MKRKGRMYISSLKSLADVRSHTRYHAVYGRLSPRAVGAACAAPVPVVKDEMAAGVGSGAPA